MLNVAIILINYNSSSYTVECIDTIIQKTSSDLSYKIYVIDNNSNLEDYSNLELLLKQKDYANVKMTRNKINRGFGGGNMSGIQIAENSEYVAFINNDTLFMNDCLSILYNFIKQNKNVGIVGGQSYKDENTEIISFDHYATVTRQILGRKFLEVIDKKNYPKRKKQYTEPLKVQTVSGSFMLIDRNAFNQIGGFDENLFLYYEETDVCRRLKEIANKDCYLVPQAKYVHYHGASTERNMAIKIEQKISLIYLIQKHYGFISKKILLTYFFFKYLLSSIVKPKQWIFVKLFFYGAPLSESLKTKQKITDN